MESLIYDVCVIGAGVIGANVARELAKYQLKIIVIEAELDVSQGASKANSGIVHGGYDATFGSLKAKLGRQGNRMFRKLNEELNFGYKEIGSMVLGFREKDLEEMQQLRDNGLKCGVDDLKII